MSSIEYYLGFGMLSCAGIYAAVTAYRFYFSNKNREKNMVKFDGLFMFYVDNKLYFIPDIKGDMEFPADKVLMVREDGTRLDVHIRNLYEQFFDHMKDKISNLRYEGLRLYVANSNQVDPYNARVNGLVRMDMNSTAEEVLRKSKELFPLANKPLVVLKLFYVRRQI